jgi:uncharacterized damage-inducible protein DinB
MILEPFAMMFQYGDWADGRLLDAAASVPDERLDESFDMGRGTLRKTLVHLWAGHDVWLARWQGKADTPWPDENQPITIAELRDRLARTQQRRGDFIAGLSPADPDAQLTYLDSLGGIFSATLGQMMLQGANHATHHRAQAVNMLRRLRAGLVELDYMMRVRTPMQ